MTSLDYFISEKISNIDLLKIDIEGYEFKILRGLIKNHNIIKFIYFEHHYDDMIIKDYKFNDIHQILKIWFQKNLKTKMLLESHLSMFMKIIKFTLNDNLNIEKLGF